jgi:3-oxoacyl-[acyl-carrier protein] reductase
MLLEGKTAIIYGAGGHIGAAVSRTFAREGADLYLTGRNPDPLEPVKRDLVGVHDVDQVDATDPTAVERHFASVVDRAGHVDVSINLVGVEDVQGHELTAMALADYLRPVERAARTQFLTATVAARHMTEQESGVILALTATPVRLALPLVGGFGAACGAIEGMLRTLAAEVGPAGVRVCWLRSAGSPESFGPDVAVDTDGQPRGLADDEYLETLRRGTLLKRFPRLSEIAEAAAFVASDRASAMTAATANATCGQIVD